MIIIRPKWKNIISGEMFEVQPALIIIIGVHPANTTIQGIFTNILQQALEAPIEHLGKQIHIGFVLTVHGEGLTHKVVGFLIHHQSILVVHNPVVRKIVHHLKFSISTNNSALTVQNIMLAKVIHIPGKLITAADTIFPFFDFSGKELKFSHSSSTALNDQAIDPVCFSIQEHLQSPFLLLNKDRTPKTHGFQGLLLLSC